MNGLNETIKTKKMPENDETEVVINTEGAVNAEAAATNRMFVRECVKERGRFSRVFETKGGEKAAVIYPKAVHFQKNGVWKSIDNTLALSKDQLFYENTQGRMKVRIDPAKGLQRQRRSVCRAEYEGAFHSGKRRLRE